MSERHCLLVCDDEPFYLGWLEDYLHSKNIDVEFAVSIDEGIERLKQKKYRALVLDLSVPFGSPRDVAGDDPAISTYPGLFLARFARNNGYRSRQVIIYSVHVEQSVRQFADKIMATFLPKGRPSMLKEEIDWVLAYDPTKDPNG